MNRLKNIFCGFLFPNKTTADKMNAFHEKKRFSWSHLVMLFMLFSASSIVNAEQFAANFKGTDINEFINTVSKNLGKTIIIDPSVKGKITVRSYEQLDEKQYYQFFLNVLDVYGYTVISMPNNVLKVLSDKSGKRAALSKSGQTLAEGDEVVMRVVPLRHVSAKDISPLLRQLNENAGVGSVAHYEQGNALLITGRADVVNGLVDVVKEMDKDDSSQIEAVTLEHASASEVARMINELIRGDGKQRVAGVATLRLVADERTNAVMFTGDESTRDYIREMIYQLDNESISQGNTQVIHLKYAKAESLVEVLSGVSSSLQNEKNGAAAPNVALLKNVVIKADEQTNSLIITAAPDVLRNLESVVEKLDVRRAQVLVEAVIVEVQDGEALNIGVQWGNKFGGGTQFSGNAPGVSGGLNSGMMDVFGRANGLLTGFYSGNWGMLLSAIASNNQNNILATPSIVTLDNAEAEFSVGQDVPILTGSQTTNSDNVFNTVSRKTVGIKLKVKPQINKGQSVLMQIEQEVSSVADNTTVGTESLGATFNIRTINNTVLVDSGETVVVGGLLDKTNSEVESSVPLLGRIPVLGALFRSKSTKESKRNLMLFIRPTIIRTTDSYAEQSSRKTDAFNAEQPAGSEINKAVRNETLSARRSGDDRVFHDVMSQINTFYAQEKAR